MKHRLMTCPLALCLYCKSGCAASPPFPPFSPPLFTSPLTPPSSPTLHPYQSSSSTFSPTLLPCPSCPHSSCYRPSDLLAVPPRLHTPACQVLSFRSWAWPVLFQAEFSAPRTVPDTLGADYKRHEYKYRRDWPVKTGKTAKVTTPHLLPQFTQA